MKIEIADINSIQPYINNPRKLKNSAIDKVAMSIKEYGFRQPIVVDANRIIVVGHTRYRASKKLGLKEVPITIAENLTQEQINAYRIADNRTNEEAEWDLELLKTEIKELELADFNLDLTGFDEDQLNNMLFEEKQGLTDEDEVPEAPEEPISKLGDIWKLGNHRLMCGDCTDTELVEKLMNNQKADMIFTDPPYGVDYKGIKNDDRKGLEELLEKSFYHYQLVSKSGASIYCFHSDRCADIFHVVFRKYFHFSSMIIWEKNSLTLSQTDYQSIHEPCLYGWNKNGTHSWFGDRKETSVWKVYKEKKVKDHTTPKPIAFIEKALKNSSKSDDNVIDLFGGSGSTIIACEKLNRNGFLMELDPKYCDVIVKRWEQFTGKKAELENGQN
jgi:DNA modification methylase